MQLDSETFDGHEFFFKRDLVVEPVREAPVAHECVCLLIKGRPTDPVAIEAIKKAAEAAGIPEGIVQDITTNEDKCHQMVESPDQSFCDSCEESEHHLLPNQRGMQHIVKEEE